MRNDTAFFGGLQSRRDLFFTYSSYMMSSQVALSGSLSIIFTMFIAFHLPKMPLESS
jgi:hypothetical protein